jgi:hypothetical protein
MTLRCTCAAATSEHAASGNYEPVAEARCGDELDAIHDTTTIARATSGRCAI